MMRFDFGLKSGPFVFRVNENGSGPNLLTQVCIERGWREYNDAAFFREEWNLWWRTCGFPVYHCKQLKDWQFVNRIPKGSSICRKDCLVRYLRCMNKVYGSVYDFSPVAYNLPLEYTKLVSEYSKRQNKDNENFVWICKPVGRSQGRGITLFRDLADLNYSADAVVQQYVANPLLIGGYKFDLRLYVCVPSYRPLNVYLYREGIVRFATKKFNLSDLDNLFCHLTNTSLNKWGSGYAEQKDRVGSGCKWTLKQLRHYFHQTGVSDWFLWQRIASIIVLTILSHMPGIPHATNCFEFYGFDILLDDNLKPWLLEVNLSPALATDCDVDFVVKKPLLHELFDLLGLPICNTGLSLFALWTRESEGSESSSDGEAKPSYGEARSSYGEARPSYGEARPSDNGRASKSRKAQGKRHRETTKKPTASEDNVWILQCPRYCQNSAHAALKSGKASRSSSSVWSNGRNWSDPPAQEGDWVRLYPMTSEDVHKENTTKSVVSSVCRYMKYARDVFLNHPGGTDNEYNEVLQKALRLTTQIWYPLK